MTMDVAKTGIGSKTQNRTARMKMTKIRCSTVDKHETGIQADGMMSTISVIPNEIIHLILLSMPNHLT